MPAIKLEALPPEEAIAFFRQKGYQIGFDWQDVWQQEHQAAFTVAKAMQLDILRDIRAGVDAALADGTPFADFRKGLKPLLVNKGWWGRADMADPLTGEVKNVQLGSTRRLKTIYDNNLRTAHGEGQWERIQASKDSFPFLQYDGNNSEHPRLTHSAWDGLVLPVDDPFWQAHLPVKEFGCKCRAIQMTSGMLERRGLTIGTSPEVPMVTYVNQRTGEVQQIPQGVHPAFHYPPGGRLANLPKFIGDKVIQAPADLGAQWWGVVGAALVPGMAQAFSGFVREVLDAGRSRNKFAVAGVMHPDDVEYLSQLDHTPQSAEIAVQDKLIVGKKAKRHVDAGDALTPEEWDAVPAGLASPRAVLYDTQTGNLIYVLDSTDERKQKLVVQVDYMTRKPKTRINMAVAGFKLPAADLLGGIKGGRYEVVRGAIE